MNLQLRLKRDIQIHGLSEYKRSPSGAVGELTQHSALVTEIYHSNSIIPSTFHSVRTLDPCKNAAFKIFVDWCEKTPRNLNLDVHNIEEKRELYKRAKGKTLQVLRSNNKSGQLSESFCERDKII